MEIFSAIWQYISTVTVMDAVDVLFVAFLLYKVMSLIRESSGAQVLKGLLLLVIATQLSEWFGLHVMNFVLKNTMQLGLLALVIVFQPELRRMLERVGRSRFPNLFIEREMMSGDINRTINQMVEAASALSWSRTGALIIIERNTRLGDIIKTGTPIDAGVSAELLKNIFFPKAPLHDGAVVIRSGRVAAAGCVLPLSVNANLSRDLGTRHRAGVGISENSDAVALIVSEETGSISVAISGMLKRHLAPETLEKLLRNELNPQKEPMKHSPIAFWRSKDK